MGGGLVFEDVCVAPQWPFTRNVYPVCSTKSAPGYYCFDCRQYSSPVEFLFATHDRPSHVANYGGPRHEEHNDAIATSNDLVQNLKSELKKADAVPPVTMTDASVQTEEVKGNGSPRLAIETLNLSSPVVSSENHILDGVEPGRDEKGDCFRPEKVLEKVGAFQPKNVEEEVRNDEERRAATLVQAWYRGHLVRKTQPLAQLRAIAVIEAKLVRLKKQAGTGAFEEELRKAKSLAKVSFEEATLALLMELDTIQGSHPLIRQIRKSAVREVVKLQEAVDVLLVGKA